MCNAKLFKAVDEIFENPECIKREERDKFLVSKFDRLRVDKTLLSCGATIKAIVVRDLVNNGYKINGEIDVDCTSLCPIILDMQVIENDILENQLVFASKCDKTPDDAYELMTKVDLKIMQKWRTSAGRWFYEDNPQRIDKLITILLPLLCP